MIYTLGNRESYDRGLQDLGANFRKLGKVDVHPNISAPYGGGIAFKNIGDAENYLVLNGLSYAVYGLECGWENTYYDDTNGIHRIIESTRIVSL